MKRVVIYWNTRNEATMSKIRERFGIPRRMSINGETRVSIRDEDLPLLLETAKRGVIQIRNKV